MRLDLLVNHFVYEAVTRGYIVIYEKHFKRNYIHIRDVADCFIFCLENFARLKDEPYNLGLDEANYNKEELAALVAAAGCQALVDLAEAEDRSAERIRLDGELSAVEDRLVEAHEKMRNGEKNGNDLGGRVADSE